MIGAMLLQELSLSIAPLTGVFGALPLTWFVDLALLGAFDGTVEAVPRALGVCGLLATAVPVFTAGTTVLARRVWERNSASSTAAGSSHSLLKTGVVERIVGERIPRDMYTVARERWLMERRVPRGLLSTGYALLFIGAVGFPLVALLGGRTTLLVYFAVALGLVSGIAFGSDPIGTEYRALPMLFTSVTGQQFVSGLLLAATVVGAPVVALAIVPLGIVGSVGAARTVLIALLGSVIRPCTASVATMIGLGVERVEYAPVPFFFTDTPIYTQLGIVAFLRHGLVLTIGVLASLPAFIRTAPLLSERIAALGVPIAGIQIGSVLLALLLAVATTRAAVRVAVQRFREYQLE